MRAESGGLLYSDLPPPPAFILLCFFFSRAAPERSGLLEQEQLELEHSGGGVRLIGRGVRLIGRGVRLIGRGVTRGSI